LVVTKTTGARPDHDDLIEQEVIEREGWDQIFPAPDASESTNGVV